MTDISESWVCRLKHLMESYLADGSIFVYEGHAIRYCPEHADVYVLCEDVLLILPSLGKCLDALEYHSRSREFCEGVLTVFSCWVYDCVGIWKCVTYAMVISYEYIESEVFCVLYG